MMRRWVVNISGWLFGAALAAYVTVPWLAEQIHDAIPVYAPPEAVAVGCGAGIVVVTARSRKLNDFHVAANQEPGWLLVTYRRDGRPFVETYPLIAPTGEVVVTRPAYVAGEDFIVGPFQFRRPSPEARSVVVSVILPGYRWGFHRTTAAIGPMLLPDC